MNQRELHNKIMSLEQQGVFQWAKARVGGVSRVGRLYDHKFWFYSYGGPQVVPEDMVTILEKYDK